MSYFNSTGPPWRRYITFITLVALMCGCAVAFNSPVTSLDDDDENFQLETIQVQPLYETNGQKWNDYVENNGNAINTADDSACDGDAQIDGGINDGDYRGYEACLHAGELRKIELPNETDCSVLALTEELGAFEWECDDSGTTTYFYSTGLKAGKKLADLLNANSWKSNVITISKDGENVYQSEDTDWWANKIYDATTFDESSLVIKDSPPYEVADNGSSGVPDVVLLKGTGAIYTIPTDYTTIGYNMRHSNMSLVVFDGATLTHNSSGNNNANASGGYAGAVNLKSLLTFGDTRRYMWIEGIFDSNSSGNRTMVLGGGSFYQIRDVEAKNSAHDNINLYTVANSRISNVKTYNSAWTGLALANVDWSLVEDVESHKNTATGLYLASGSDYNRIRNVRTADNNMLGVHLADSSDTILYNIYSYNNGTVGFQQDAASTRNTITKSYSVANGSAGFQNSASYNAISHFTSVNNGADGYVSSFSGSYNTIVQSVFSSNAGNGVLIGLGPVGNQFSNVVIADNNSYGVYLWSSSDNTFTDNLLIGNNTSGQCNVVTSTGNNISTDGGSICGGDDGPTGLSVSDHDAISLVGEFNGFVSDDNASLHDADLELNGYVAFTDMLDWINVSDVLRLWGKGDSATFLADANAGRCTSGNCRLWDLSLDSAASVILNQSETGSTANNVFAVGSPCPDALIADYTITDVRGTELTDGIGNDNGTCEFMEICEYELVEQGGNDDLTCDGGENCSLNSVILVNALEIMDDGIGDEDGLCESDEACTYSPNFGIYQGHGSVGAETCSYTDGITDLEITGPSIYAYPNNGR